MDQNLDKVKLLALDLREGGDVHKGKVFPSSPRRKLGGFVLAARAVDKCRADLAGTIGEYHTNCPLDKRWLEFAGLSYDDLRALIATGATDDDIDAWIRKTAKKTPEEIAVWNNQQRDARLSEMPAQMQAYFEDYIEKYVPRNRNVYHWFDVYDIEELRM